MLINFINKKTGLVILHVTYPVESFFYPYHLVIALVTSAIFLTIVITYRQYLARKAEEYVAKMQKKRAKAAKKRGLALSVQQKEEKTPPPTTPTRADAIALGSLIVSIAVTGILPLLLSPLLDYSVYVQENESKLTIDITNLGLASANNIISSVSAKNVTFSNFEPG